jgi:gliding motility-associated-like protein
MAQDRFPNLQMVAQAIQDNNKPVTLLYAFNATGKTRLSMEFKNLVNGTDEMNGDEDKNKRVLYYNAFTEDLFYWDNDLSNDVYSLNFENAKALNAIIVNRWGNLIYTFTSPLQTWDGTSNGIECPEGVYFVKYEVTAINNEIFKGQQFIHLIR